MAVSFPEQPELVNSSEKYVYEKLMTLSDSWHETEVGGPFHAVVPEVAIIWGEKFVSSGAHDVFWHGHSISENFQERFLQEL